MTTKLIILMAALIGVLLENASCNIPNPSSRHGFHLARIPSMFVTTSRHPRRTRTKHIDFKRTMDMDPILAPDQTTSSNSSIILCSTPKYSAAKMCKLFMTSSPQRSSSTSQYASTSPWAPGTWKITLDLGRDDSRRSNDNAAMPSASLFENPKQSNSSRKENDQKISSLLGEEWGASGGRLVLSFEVLVTTDLLPDENSKRSIPNQLQSARLGGKPTGTIKCLSLDEENDDDYCATYINTSGQQKVKISPGQWRIEPPQPILSQSNKILSGQASTLRFHLTIQNSIERNSIFFPENQLLFLQSNAFRLPVYEMGIQTMLPYQYAKEYTQKALEEQLNHETGDRRLDGTDLLETLEGYKDLAGLVGERDEAWRRWKDVVGVLPKLPKELVDLGGLDRGKRSMVLEGLLEDDDRWGVWPGDVEPMTIEKGLILAVVSKSKRLEGKGVRFPWMESAQESVEETVVVGRWSAVPVFDEDEYINDD
ncbi:hypothetical protein ACHAXS_009246 [Conticribra weissflogii]